MRRILLFEDDEGEGTALVDALRREAPAHGFGSDLEILWFRDRPRMMGWRWRPRAQSAQLTPSPVRQEKDDEVDSRLPIFVSDRDPPPRLYGTEGERIVPDDPIWWPVDFHAILVDRFHEGSGQDVGDLFLKWLGNVRFRGPVGVITRYTRPPGTPAHLTDVENESKLKEGWVERVTTGLLSRLAARSRNDGPYVGTRGQNPIDFDLLARFYDKNGNESAPVEWKTLWLGTDESARTALLRFFPNLAPVEPGIRWRFLWDGAFPGLSDLKDDPLAVVRAWLKVLERVSGHTDFPDLLWIDLGQDSVLTPHFMEGLAEALSVFAGNKGLSFLTVLLVDRVGISSGQETELLRHGVLIEERDLLREAPVVWLERTMDGLSEAWDPFIRASKKPLEADVYVRFLKFYFRALLVSHTRGRLVSGRAPAEWFTSYPGDSSVSTSLVRQLREKVWDRMPQGLVSSRLERHFVGEDRH